MNLDVGDVAEYLTQDIPMDSIQVGKAVFGKEIYTTLGIEPRSSNHYSVSWFTFEMRIFLGRSWLHVGWHLSPAIFGETSDA